MERTIEALSSSLVSWTPQAEGGMTPPSAPRSRASRCRWRRRLAAAFFVTVVGAGSSGATFLLMREGGTEAEAGAVSLTVPETTGSAPPSTAAQMLKRVLPSVVNVRVTQTVQVPFFGARSQSAEGSGVILSKDGVIVTNSHVVEGASSVEVEFTDGHPAMTATVLGTDPDHDMAVIKVDATDLSPITVGDSDALTLGDTVYAVGFPLELGPTVTEGIVSGTDRTIDVQGTSGIEHLTGLLQTDAAINSGNSGGALVNADGQLVGIPTAAAQASVAENVGFAIGIDSAMAAVGRLGG